MKNTNNIEIKKKLAELCGYRAMMEAEYDFDCLYCKLYHDLKKELSGLIYNEYGELIKLLAVSGFIKFIVGNENDDSYIVMDSKSSRMLECDDIVIISSGIIESSSKIPNELVDWYQDNYSIIQLEQRCEQ